MKAASYFLFVLAGVACAVVLASFLASDVRARFSAWKHGGIVGQETASVRGTDLPADGSQSGAAAPADDPRWTSVMARLSAAESAAAELESRVAVLESRSAAPEPRPQALGGTTVQSAPVPVDVPAPVQGPAAPDLAAPPSLALKLSVTQLFPTGDRDLFGIVPFAGPRSTAYRDRQFEARWWFFDGDYASVKAALASGPYKVNETNAFFGRSAFANAQPADGFVRILFEASGKAVAVEVVRERYEAVKKLLLK